MMTTLEMKKKNMATTQTLSESGQYDQTLSDDQRKQQQLNQVIYSHEKQTPTQTPPTGMLVTPSGPEEGNGNRRCVNRSVVVDKLNDSMLMS